MSRIGCQILKNNYQYIRLPKITTRHLYCSTIRWASDNQERTSSQSSVQSYRGGNQVSKDVRPIGERVKETAQTTSYLGIIIGGLAVTAAMFYTIFSELFSSKSPNNVYSQALNRCIDEPRVQDLLGTPLKGYGEETRRGRRGHVQHLSYKKDDKQFLRMKFYIQGSRNKGTVFLEMQEDDFGKYQYRYLFVQVDDFVTKTLILEDNRTALNKSEPLQGFL